MEPDYYYQYVNIGVASGVVERLKACKISKLLNFKEILEMLGINFDGYAAKLQIKTNFWSIRQKL